jgi:hypothetical protein
VRDDVAPDVARAPHDGVLRRVAAAQIARQRVLGGAARRALEEG